MKSVKVSSSAPKKAKTMASDFLDSKGILIIDYLWKGKAINQEYYANLLTKRRKKRDKQKKNDFHQDNASARKGILAS